MDRRDRIKELRRNNATALLCKRWNENGVVISPNDFLNQSESLLLQKMVMTTLDNMDSSNESLVYLKSDHAIESYQKKIMSLIQDDARYCFFIKDSFNLGAVSLTGRMIKEHSSFLLNESGYFENSCSIICCSINADSGLCLWRGEYDERIYQW